MTKLFWLTPKLLEAAEGVELDYFHDREDLPRGVLRAILPASDEDREPFTFRFTPKVTTGCRLQFKVELNGQTVGANLDAADIQPLYVAAEQRTFDDRNRERDGDDARRAELLAAAEKAFRAKVAGKTS
jgi:hypothetical protein